MQLNIPMQPTIQLRNGDLLAQSTDLIIVPCSTDPATPVWDAERMRALGFVPPVRPLETAEVCFDLFGGPSNLATYVGYTASTAIALASVTRVARQIYNFVADKPEVRDISLPLFGPDPDGLPTHQSLDALVMGLTGEDAERKVFNIYIPDSAAFAALVSYFDRSRTVPAVDRSRYNPGGGDLAVAAASGKKREPVRVFISYAKTDDEHESWVWRLAVFLRSKGIDARLDEWRLDLGADLTRWMEAELALAERVLVICNKEYARKAADADGGVGWEMRLVKSDLYHAQKQDGRQKYIPIVRKTFDRAAVPACFQGSYCLVIDDIGENKQTSKLLKALYDVYNEEPPLGTPPRFVLR
ncbi:toll/interleukin-1 receptor domain-containing protein [Rhodoplanes elegans]|nr:toll/interleukin-1 receptor domain-containing protein [Rhodoplanes elegans]